MNITKTFAIAAAVLVAGISSSQALSFSVSDYGMGSGLLLFPDYQKASDPEPKPWYPGNPSYTGTFDITNLYNPATMTVEDVKFTLGFSDPNNGGETAKIFLGDVLFTSLSGVPNGASTTYYEFTLSGSFLTDLAVDGMIEYTVLMEMGKGNVTLKSATLAGNVPEGGSTAVLLGCVIVGVALLRQRLSSAKA